MTLTKEEPKDEEGIISSLESYFDADKIKDALVRQLYSPVRWTETVNALVAEGIAESAECGPGKVLTSLNKRIDKRPGAAFLAVEDPASIDAALAAVQGG